MDQFIQYTPTEVVFGKETENQAGAEVKKWGGTKVLVVYGGGSAKRSGLLDRVEASLAKEGLAFYLIPDFERMKQIGIAKTITGAMNQAFFTLSLGIGAMAIWGSYIGKERSLLGESVNIAILDTFVAITSGLIIFPACFTFHVDQTSGPSLIFITLPNIFNHIPLGRLWGSLFFLFMFFAAFSTILAVFENIISCGMELTGCSRQKSCPCHVYSDTMYGTGKVFQSLAGLCLTWKIFW